MSDTDSGRYGLAGSDAVVYTLSAIVLSIVCFVEGFAVNWIVIIISIVAGVVLLRISNAVEGRPVLGLPVVLLLAAIATIVVGGEAFRPGGVALFATMAVLKSYEIVGT